MLGGSRLLMAHAQLSGLSGTDRMALSLCGNKQPTEGPDCQSAQSQGASEQIFLIHKAAIVNIELDHSKGVPKSSATSQQAKGSRAMIWDGTSFT